MSQIKHALPIVYLATFFYSLHYALTLYIESSFLGTFLPTQSVGLLFTVAAIISVLILFNFSSILRRFGNYSVILTAVIFEAAALFVLSDVSDWRLMAAFFIIHQILLNVIFFSLNIFLEAFSKDETTGSTRGIFLTVINSAIIAGPFIAGNLFEDGDFRTTFLVAGVIVLLILFFMGGWFKNFADPQYARLSILNTIGSVAREKELRSIFVVQFLLEFFFSIMVIYTPIYLYQTIGIPLSQIVGIIMPIALLPFVVFPYTLGNLADKRFGEKEMLFAGFLVMSIATASISLIVSQTIFIWAVILLLTRIGASFVETMAESYFFKHISVKETNIISFFRNLRPMSYLIAPVVASAFLSLFDSKYLFLGVGAIMLIGLYYSFILKDTR